MSSDPSLPATSSAPEPYTRSEWIFFISVWVVAAVYALAAAWPWISNAPFLWPSAVRRFAAESHGYDRYIVFLQTFEVIGASAWLFRRRYTRDGLLVFQGIVLALGVHNLLMGTVLGTGVCAILGTLGAMAKNRRLEIERGSMK